MTSQKVFEALDVVGICTTTSLSTGTTVTVRSSGGCPCGLGAVTGLGGEAGEAGADEQMVKLAPGATMCSGVRERKRDPNRSAVASEDLGIHQHCLVTREKQ